MPRRRAGAKASLALRRDACVGVGRRGSAGLLRARAAFDVHIHMYLHTTTKNLARRAPSSRRCSRGWTWRRRRSPGTTARPASESSDDCWPAQAWWTTTSLGPPNCHTEQWSLPPAHVHGQNRPLSRVSLSVERAFLNSQRARVARHNPPRVIGKPGSLPSLCLLGGHVLWPRLRLVPAAAAAVAAPAAAVATATSPVVVAPAAIVAAVAAAAATVPAAAAAVVVAAAAAAVAPAAVVVAAACMDTVNYRSHCSLDGAIDEDAPRSLYPPPP